MGDHRATVKVEFTIHGKMYRMDSYINWFDDGDGIDRRVVEFFRDAWRDAYARYCAEEERQRAEAHAADIERSERAEFERLRVKYGRSG